MPALRKYDQETRDRAVRMCQDRLRDFPAESVLQARRRVGELLDVKPDTLRGWIERVEIDAGERGVRHRSTPHVYCPGVPADGCEFRVRREAAELQDRINGEVAAGAATYAVLEAQGLSHSQIVELVMVMSGVDPADVPGLC